MDRLERLEADDRGDLPGELVDGDEALVRADVDGEAVEARREREVPEETDHVAHRAEAALLQAVAVDVRLPALEHEVDHDRGDVAVRVVVLLPPRRRCRLGHRDDALDAVGDAEVVEQLLARDLGDAVGVDGADRGRLGEGHLGLAVAGHRRAVHDAPRAVRDRGREGRDRRLHVGLHDRGRREDAEPLVRGGGGVHDDVGVPRRVLHRLEIAAVDLEELRARRDVVAIAARQIVAAADGAAAGQELVGEVGAEEAGDPGDEDVVAHRAAP
ncbi:MAG: hypothetical protein R3B82_25160 [Sandaracinaceae bacterium]